MPILASPLLRGVLRYGETVVSPSLPLCRTCYQIGRPTCEGCQAAAEINDYGHDGFGSPMSRDWADWDWDYNPRTSKIAPNPLTWEMWVYGEPQAAD